MAATRPPVGAPLSAAAAPGRVVGQSQAARGVVGGPGAATQARAAWDQSGRGAAEQLARVQRALRVKARLTVRGASSPARSIPGWQPAGGRHLV